MATIREVAKAAGVSTATVSNVLNGRLERVSTETQERVLATVRALKYRPTALEKNQKAILTQNVGVIVPDLTEGPLRRHNYFRNILDGVLESAALRGWSVTIFIERMWSDVGLAARRSYDGRCDGLIIVAPQPGGEIVEALQKRGIPLVIVGTTAWLPGVSSVDIDNRQVGEAAARHLVSLGHRTIAFCDHEPEQVSGIERHAGFVAAARAVGLSDEDVLYVGVPIPEADPHYGAVAWDRLLGQARRPTGILCWNDGLALALLRSAAGKGIKVPEDISIIGVDDIPDGETSSPALTTFRNPLSEIGRAATTLLIELLGEQSDRSEIVRFPSELVVRGSTARP